MKRFQVWSGLRGFTVLDNVTDKVFNFATLEEAIEFARHKNNQLKGN